MMILQSLCFVIVDNIELLEKILMIKEKSKNNLGDVHGIVKA